MFTFEKLDVYRESIQLVHKVYLVTDSWPRSEIFGLTSQFRRAAVSVSLNIAEGSGRTKKDFRHFLDISRSSCQECVALLQIAKLMEFIDNDTYEELYTQFSIIAKRVSALKRSILP